MRRMLGVWAGVWLVGVSAWAQVDNTPENGATEQTGYRLIEREATLEQDMLFDLYQVEVDQGQQLIVNVRSNQFDTYASVRSPSGVHTANDDWNRASGHSHVHLLAEESGTWQVRVAGYDIDSYGDYKIELFVGDESPDGTLPPIAHRGTLEEGDDEVVGAPEKYIDRYSFEAEQGQHVTIDLTSYTLDTVLMLEHSGGASWENDDYANDPGHSRLSLTLDKPGVYTASVTSYEAKETGGYDLLIQRGPAPPKPMAVDKQTHQGELTADDPKLVADAYTDTYPIEGRAGEQVTITLDATAFDTFLALTQDTSPDQPIAENDDAVQGNTNQSQIVHTLPADGAYTVSVTSYEPGETGAYMLSIERLAAPEGDVIRGELAEGDLTHDGGKRIDWLPVPIEAGQHVVAVVESRDFDTYLIFETPTGERWVNDDDLGRSDRSRVELDADWPGVYRVGVTSFEAGEGGAYELDIRIKPGDDPEGMRRSRAIEAGQPMTGELVYGDTVLDNGELADRFHFDAEQGQRVVLDLKSEAFDTWLRVQGPDGAIDFNDDYDGEGHSRLDFTVDQPGRYRVVATSFDADETGAYELSLNLRNDADAPPPDARVHGLFIGISDYGGDGDLAYCAEDADRLYRRYRESDGMRAEDATLLLDQKATVENIERALQSIAERASANDTVVIFYSGHGSQLPRDEGFTASDPDAKDETLSVVDGEITDDRFAELLEPCHAATTLVMIDACFSGGFAKDVVSKPGRIGLFSSEEDVLSMVAEEFEAGGYLSLFVHEALGEQRDDADLNSDKAVTAHELSHYVAKRYAQTLREPKRPSDFIEGTEVDPGVNLSFQKLVVDRGGVHPHHVLLAWD